MVVINLYPFEETIAREGVSTEEAIEQIDIGGPAMIRSAAKNFLSVAAVTAKETWPEIVDEMKANDGRLSLATRHKLAAIAYTTTFTYDAYVSRYLFETSAVELPEASPGELPLDMSLSLEDGRALRYGENPHQLAALYEISDSDTQGVARAELLAGKEMSFNNYVDADAAWQLVVDFDELACAIIKHTNPAGVALGESGRTGVSTGAGNRSYLGLWWHRRF